MEKTCALYDSAGNWSDFEPQAPYLSIFFLLIRVCIHTLPQLKVFHWVIQGGSEALVEHMIRHESEGGGGILWKEIKTPELSLIAKQKGISCNSKYPFEGCVPGAFWVYVENQSINVRRACSELLSVLTMSDIGNMLLILIITSHHFCQC